MKKLFSTISFLSVCFFVFSQKIKTEDSLILSKIKAGAELLANTKGDDLKKITGATHASGKYHFTQLPFMVEGAQKLDSMGFGVLKLWLIKNPDRPYPYNSEWKFKKSQTLKELIQHPYYEKALSYPFETIVLSIASPLSGKKSYEITEENSKKEEEEIYELTAYLFKKYKKRKVTFILQNWEGDWIFRSGFHEWGKKEEVPDETEIKKRSDGMIAWFTARQRGVTRAQNEFKKSKCKVFHAIEVNKVMHSMRGIPGLTSHVLPHVKTDMVSWSCYDGLVDNKGINFYKGIDYIKQKMNVTGVVKNPVMIGEIGIPENISNNGEESVIVERWKAYMAVMMAQNISHIIHWELYCNEAKDDKSNGYYPLKKNDELRGFWLIRPDGTESFFLKYFKTITQKNK